MMLLQYEAPRSSWSPSARVTEEWTPPNIKWTPPTQQWCPPDSPTGVEFLPAGTAPAIDVQPTAPADARRSDVDTMTQLLEMGFADRVLNQRLLSKHDNDLEKVVPELLSLADNDWHANRH